MERSWKNVRAGMAKKMAYQGMIALGIKVSDITLIPGSSNGHSKGSLKARMLDKS